MPQATAEGAVKRALRRALGRGPRVDELGERGKNAAPSGPLLRALSRVAAVVFPVNNSGNNRSVR